MLKVKVDSTTHRPEINMSDDWYPGYPLEVLLDFKNDPCYRRKVELIQQCKELVGTRNFRRRPLNIAVVGPPGCGKSSFLNTIFASFSLKRWMEHARYGDFEYAGRQVTRQLNVFDRKTYFSDDDDVLMPTFLDMSGFEDVHTELNTALLDIIFSGKIKQNETLIDPIRFGREHGETALRIKYQGRYSQYRVDRIIVVCSSDPDSNLPEILLKNIIDIATFKDIPVYGVLTHADKFQVDYDDRIAKREKKFKALLGIPETRYARVVNYCPAIDPTLTFEDAVIPTLDVPVLRLMRQILKPQPNDTNMILNNIGFYASVGTHMFLIILVVFLTIFLSKWIVGFYSGK